MSYYGYGYRRRGGRRGPYVPNYGRLTSMFGEAVKDIQQAFRNLPPDAMRELLLDYESAHGEGPAKYARATVAKWQSGNTQMSGQTMERLIDLVPPYLTPEQRLALLKKVVVLHRPSNAHYIFVNRKEPAEGLRQLDAALATLRTQGALANVPEYVMAAAKWLYDDDMTAARAVLQEIDRRETDTSRASAQREIELLRRTIATGQVQKASYSVSMPGGSLDVNVGTTSKCFVATVCFGEAAWQTHVLRAWRDEVLVQHAAGRRFVRWYYRRGPALARAVAQRPWLQCIATRVVNAVARSVQSSRSSR